MAIINKIDNVADVVFGGNTILSNSVRTLLNLAPTITKLVDKLTANIGDTLTYTITITNVGLQTINSLPFSDTIGAGATYVASSFTVNGSSATPTINGAVLSYTIPSIASLATAIITFQVTVVGGSN